MRFVCLFEEKDLNILIKVLTTYRSDGEVIEKIIYNEDGCINTIKTYEYFNDSQHKKSIKEWDNSYRLLKQYVFDKKGYLIEKCDFVTDDKYIYKYTFIEDQLIESFESMADNVARRTKYIYDSQGRKIKEIYEETIEETEYNSYMFETNDLYFIETGNTTFEYSIDGKLKRRNGDLNITYNDNDEGFIESQSFQIAEDEWKVIFKEYDYEKKLIKSWVQYDIDQKYEVVDYKYTYDNRGNWIIRSRICENCVITDLKRVIGYYK